MIARITLSHSVLGLHEISIPEGWEESVLSLERSDKFYSLIEEFDGKFVFYGSDGNGIDGGIDFIRSVLLTYGPDADLSILFELSFDEVVYETLFDGLLDLSMKQDIDDNTVQVPIIRNDFWSKFINRYETPVDLQTSSNVDGEPVTVYEQINLSMSSQTIDKVHYSYERNGNTFEAFTDTYVQYQPDTIGLDELKEYYLLPNSSNPELPVWMFEFEYDGIIDVNIRIEYSRLEFVPANGHESPSVFKFYIKRNNDTAIEFNFTTNTYYDDQVYDNWAIFTPASNEVITGVATYIGTFEILKGDILRIYIEKSVASDKTLSFWGTDGLHIYNGAENIFVSCARAIGMIDVPTYIRITQHTTYPTTNSEGFLIHDAASNICDRITGEENSFYSEYFGSQNTLTRQYNSDGCGWNNALHKGLQIRQYSLLEKPFFMSFKQWWEGGNPIFNLGLGYDIINGNEVIRVEQKKHFYSDDVSVNFSNVNNIRLSFDNNMFFNVVEIGFKKWESEDISGIDDPQTKRSYSTRFKKVGNKITLHSEFIAAGLAIETTRRTTREKSADYKYDNDVFIIVIRPYQIDVSPETSPDVIDYEPELAENFVTVDNVTNYESRYNLVLTPARQLLRWLNYLSGCLQKYTSSFFKFASGEGNYDMTSRYEVQSPDCGIFDYNGNTLSEKGDIAVSTDYLHLPDLLTITNLPMSWEEYELIRDNREMAIGISQTNSGHIECYINTLKYSFLEGKADITCWPKTEFVIEIVEQEFIQNC